MSSSQDRAVLAATVVLEVSWLFPLAGVAALALGQEESPLGWLAMMTVLGLSLVVTRLSPSNVAAIEVVYLVRTLIGATVVYLTVGTQIAPDGDGVDLMWPVTALSGSGPEGYVLRGAGGYPPGCGAVVEGEQARIGGVSHGGSEAKLQGGAHRSGRRRHRGYLQPRGHSHLLDDIHLLRLGPDWAQHRARSAGVQKVRQGRDVAQGDRWHCLGHHTCRPRLWPPPRRNSCLSLEPRAVGDRYRRRRRFLDRLPAYSVRVQRVRGLDDSPFRPPLRAAAVRDRRAAGRGAGAGRRAGGGDGRGLLYGHSDSGVGVPGTPRTVHFVSAREGIEAFSSRTGPGLRTATGSPSRRTQTHSWILPSSC